MKIAIAGCVHGELQKIYDTVKSCESKENIKVDLLICCGDFQSTRNEADLRCMAVPPKYYNIGSFYKYYSGEEVAPYLTIFIGGNHEASNYLQELEYGGWVAPNIWYIGYAGVIRYRGLRIAGLSGIYKSGDYFKAHFEKSPYSEGAKRSVYHIRQLEVFRLKQIEGPIDIMLSHDWPDDVTRFGNVQMLTKRKPFLKSDIEQKKLGSPPAAELLFHLKPSYWFAAHLHTKFSALVTHPKADDDENTSKKYTKFLALDKCIPGRDFLQVVDVETDIDSPDLHYDLEWLTILYLTNHLVSAKNRTHYLPGPGSTERWKFTPTDDEKNHVFEKMGKDLKVPENFKVTSPVYDPACSSKDIQQPGAQINEQTASFCRTLGIESPLYSILISSTDWLSSSSLNSSRTDDTTFCSFDSSQPNIASTDQSNVSGSSGVNNRFMLSSPGAKCSEKSFNNVNSDSETNSKKLILPSPVSDSSDKDVRSNKKREFTFPSLDRQKNEELISKVDVNGDISSGKSFPESQLRDDSVDENSGLEFSESFKVKSHSTGTKLIEESFSMERKNEIHSQNPASSPESKFNKLPIDENEESEFVKNQSFVSNLTETNSLEGDSAIERIGEVGSETFASPLPEPKLNDNSNDEYKELECTNNEMLISTLPKKQGVLTGNDADEISLNKLNLYSPESKCAQNEKSVTSSTNPKLPAAHDEEESLENELSLNLKQNRKSGCEDSESESKSIKSAGSSKELNIDRESSTYFEKIDFNLSNCEIESENFIPPLSNFTSSSDLIKNEECEQNQNRNSIGPLPFPNFSINSFLNSPCPKFDKSLNKKEDEFTSDSKMSSSDSSQHLNNKDKLEANNDEGSFTAEVNQSNLSNLLEESTDEVNQSAPLNKKFKRRNKNMYAE